MKDVIKRLRNLSLQTHQAISSISMLGGGIAGWIFTQFNTVFGIALCATAFIGGIVWHIIFVRCPHCGHHFNPRATISNFCPECGKKL